MWLNNYPKQPQILQGLLMLNVSVKIGEELKLDVLLPNADKVETNSSGEWREVWKRGHGVCCERMTDRDGNLSIKEFTSNDTGTYRVLDSEGETLITHQNRNEGRNSYQCVSVEPAVEGPTSPNNSNGYVQLGV
uniref:Uncharacterized protein n=1 Tax=Cyprinus carpio TaxID=7962 RepID=A0A8C2FF33_CYPCA